MKRFTLLLIVLVLGVFTASAQLESPLDLPQIPDFTLPHGLTADAPMVEFLYPMGYVPFDNTHLSYYSSNLEEPVPGEKMVSEGFMWGLVKDVVEYQLRFRDVETGETLRYKVPAALIGYQGCSIDVNLCFVLAGPAGLLSDLHHNHTYKWFVVGKRADGTKVKGIKMTFTVEHLQKPFAIGPFGQWDGPASSLWWTDQDHITKYVLTVKHVETGETVFKQAMAPSPFLCSDGYIGRTCILNLPDEVAMRLNNGDQYRWFVKAKSYFGGIEKSVKQTFYVSAGG